MKELLERACNFVVALLLLALLAPLGVIVAIAIVLDSPGPVFFRPRRIGRNGVRFRAWMFRTMSGPAEDEASDSGQAKFTPTKVGLLLRRYKFDEAPLLFNVLLGQMQVTGPRPENPQFSSFYRENYRDVLEFLPGITGSPGLTLFDEERLLSRASSRGATYKNDVLPLKHAADLNYVKQATWRTSGSLLLLTGIQALRVSVQRMPVWSRRAGKLIADATIVVVAAVTAHFVRLGPDEALWELHSALALLIPLVVLRLFALYMAGAYRSSWRYTSISDLTRLVGAISGSSAMFAAFLYAFNWGPATYPRSVFVLEWSLSILGLMGIRAALLNSHRLVSGRLTTSHESSRVLIYGGGNAGVELAASLIAQPSGRHPVGFIDDNPTRRGALLHGVPVLGDGSTIERFVEALGIDEIIIAMPKASGEQIRKIVFRCENLPCKLTTLPSLSEVLAGQRREVRDVKVEDLLERKAAHVDLEALADLLEGQRVLVTGAGGSIGSELCRQIASFNPDALILLGHGENSIFEVHQELLTGAKCRLIPVIADIQDRTRLGRVFQEHRPDIVFHAAAHKHVPLMEQNPEEAIKNNVLGTLNLAELAVEAGAARFVMVSSDKAVNPTSVMGATKRLTEMIMQTIAGDPGVRTRFTAVRFGNVLGSRGSLVPVLRRQIARGGPVTITHPDMVRYFMTIPEAVQLMLQASTMGGQGEIFVLDMGEPVRIVDLVNNLIRLSGLIPGKDIKIKYTGMRPGEKMFEEMLTTAEGATTTRHRQVFIAQPILIDPNMLASGISRLETAAVAGDQQAIRETLGELIGARSAGLGSPTGRELTA